MTNPWRWSSGLLSLPLSSVKHSSRFSLVTLVIFHLLLNSVHCDWDSLAPHSSQQDLSPDQEPKRNSVSDDRNSADPQAFARQPQWRPSNNSALWTTSKRHRHKHKRFSLVNQSPNAKSINEIVRTRVHSQPRTRSNGRTGGSMRRKASWEQANFGPSPEFDYELETESSQSNQIGYFNQSFVPRSFPSSLPRSSTSRTNHHWKKRNHLRGHHHKEEGRPKRPNIIFMLTDDQDIELGSMNYMPKTMQILAKGGVYVKNAYVTTPMCCPSRSSILTGLYVHNHNVYTNGENCSSSQWQQTHERRTFATYLRDSGYRTAFFGKYLNEYNGSYIPPGWSDWSALVRNSRYYNYTLNVNGDKVRHGANYELDYYPDLILNDSLQYMRYSKRSHSSKPYLMVMSFPSPHGPEDAAPQYQDMFLQEKGHRTPSWNHAPNRDKQWLLRNTHKMAPIHQEFTDFLNAKRLQTLQSIDEAVHQIYSELKNLGELDNTYIIYTSDHGYHLGQFGLVKGKAMPFEFDIRVPFYVRGPGIATDRTLPQIVLNIDIAPTLIDMAGLKVPPHMDGVSFLPSLRQLNSTNVSTESRTDNGKIRKLPQRDSFLIEKGKFKMPNSIDRLLIPIIGKKRWLQLECQKAEYQSPCKMFQKFECFQDEKGTFRIRKCHRSHLQRSQRKKCICAGSTQAAASVRSYENEVIIKRYGANKAARGRRYGRQDKRRDWHRERSGRVRRSEEAFSALLTMLHDEPILADINGAFDVEAVYQLKKLVDLAKAPVSAGSHFDANNPASTGRTGRMNPNDISNITTSQLVSILAASENFSSLSNYTDYLNRTFCTVARTNLSIECTEEIYQDHESWKEKKGYIDSAIRELQRRLFELKGIRRFMNEKRPNHKAESGRVRGAEELCQCDGDQESLSTGPQFGLLSTRQQQHPRRHVERRFMKHLNRKKWMRRKEKKLRRKEKFENTTCEMAASEQMNCFTHDNDHWKTPPIWTNGPFCFCQNSLNNSFWCMRTINETHNFLYCEFVTDFIVFFDHLKDPFQLRNAILDLEVSTVEELSRELSRLKGCSGSAQCSHPLRQQLQQDSLARTAKNHHSRHHKQQASLPADLQSSHPLW